jgi:aryl-phospho-beta-D-glucosidase BglC (GH1 family)
MTIDFILVLLAIFAVANIVHPRTSQNKIHFRGTMINPHLTADDFRVLASWKANHIRWQLLWGGDGHPADNATVAEYEAWLDSALNQFDLMLPVLRELGLNILLDLHTSPGGRDPKLNWRMFNEKQFQDQFLSVWEMMANRYKNESIIMGYDLVNEPDDRDVIPGLMNWHDLASTTTQRIRAIDPQRSIIVEAPPGSGPNTLPNFEPIPFDNVIYSFHMYEPTKFTFQNLRTNDTPPVYYPGTFDGKMWNKEQLRALMQPNVDWQKTHNVSIHIGEFSAIRWAPGNSTANYLSDLIDLFEENGWTWNYHAFREWQGWDVEMIGDMNNPRRSPVPTDRQLVLLKWFEQNEH